MKSTIKITEKKCKGTGVARGYGCGEMTKFRKYGLCTSKCYPKWLYTTEEGLKRVNKATLRATKDRRELEKLGKEKKERESLSRLLNRVKNICHKYIKMRDEGLPCISCKIPYKSDFDAGHYFKAELYSTLRFDEKNIHAQCIKCNRAMEGNLNPYSINLEKKIGIEEFSKLKEKASKDKQGVNYWDKDELKEKLKYYQEKIKELKK